jgi:DNA-binding transcriptional regulator LsrR (DeoR family)
MPRKPSISRELRVKAVQLLVEKGLAPASIARQLLPDMYSGTKNEQSRAITTVRRAIQYAIDRGWLKFRPPKAKGLVARLRDKYPDREFIVVNDRGLNSFEDVLSLVAHAAAQHLATLLDKLLTQKAEAAHKAPFVIGLAGGPAVTAVLQRLPPYLHIRTIPSQVVCLALNTAARPNQYDQSAIFQAVRLAEILGRQHLVHTSGCRQPAADEHKQLENQFEDLAKSIDLIICGAGTRTGALCARLDPADLQKQGIVGDVLLHPINADGERVNLTIQQETNINESYHPRPTFTHLRMVAGKKRTFFVLPPAKIEGAASLEEGRRARGTVGAAILRSGLAWHVITTASIARHILADREF